MEQSQIFRKKSIEKITSPEKLDDYIRVTTPSVWIILAGIVLLLVGAVVWGVFGHLDTKLTTGAVCRDGGDLIIFISEEYASQMSVGMKVTAADRDYTITGISDQLFQITDRFDPYALHAAGLAVGDFGITVKADTDLPDGAYKVVVTLKSVSPISYIVN